MTPLRPAALQSGAQRTSRRGLTLLSGFLGSGKTTLLRAELARAGQDAPAVILNDFGQTMTDDILLVTQRRRPGVLAGGCACCTRLQQLALALRDLLDAEHRDATLRHDQVVIETSGLSDPGPIAFTVANDPILRHHYTVTRICVTVDALVGLANAERHEVARIQVMAADDLVITKSDLADPTDVERLVGRLHELNPSAGVTITANGQVLRAEPPRTAADGRLAVQQVAPAAHTDGVSTFEFTTDEHLDWQRFSIWLSLLLHAHGPDILRVKGVLRIDRSGPIAINCVQHIVHRPEHLPGDALPGSRLVFIVRDIDAEILKRSFHAFLAIK